MERCYRLFQGHTDMVEQFMGDGKRDRISGLGDNKNGNYRYLVTHNKKYHDSLECCKGWDYDGNGGN